MKKFFFIVIVIFVSIFIYIRVNADVNMDDIVIPDAAIRVRVIAHSNSIHDQSMKMKVKEYIENSISRKLVSVSNVEEARDIINGEIINLESGIQNIFDDYDYSMSYMVHFGDNFFPEKEYKGVHYEAGAYESLVVTIGEGNGDNWWCVLFPPLCLLEADESQSSDVEYQFFVKKMIDKIFNR